MIIIEAVNQLIKMGYEFKTGTSGNIDYEFVGKNITDELQVMSLFEKIRSRKQEALEYLNTTIKVTVDFKTGAENGEYRFYVFNGEGQQIYSYSLNNAEHGEAVEYINKKFTDNQRFINIAAFLSKSTGIFRYYGSDTKRVDQAAKEYKQLDFSKIGTELTPDDPAYYECPWG